MNVYVRVTDSHKAYPTVWINAPANARTMANYNFKAPEGKHYFLERVCVWGGGGNFNESRHAGRESNCELSNHDVAILTILRDVR